MHCHCPFESPVRQPTRHTATASYPAAAQPQSAPPRTQVEIKLRLPSKEAHDRVAHELRESYRETHKQENYFFDGPGKELSAQRSVLRCRFYNHDKRALVTLKAGSIPGREQPASSVFIPVLHDDGGRNQH